MSIEWLANTRPKPLQEASSAVIESHGLRAFSLPVIDIEYLISGEEFHNVLSQCDENSVLVFTSQFAVLGFFQSPPSDIEAQFVAVGAKTAETLREFSVASVRIPQKQNSEGVIELLQEDVSIDRVVVVGGVGGRRQIESWAHSSNIPFSKLEVYRRVPVAISESKVEELLGIKNLGILATSVSTLAHLKDSLKEKQWMQLSQLNLYCASERIFNKASDLGFVNVYNLNTSDLKQMVERIHQSEPQH